MAPRISIIAAISTNRVIGRDNKLPWDIPDDLKRFRAITSGHPIIMGRKTFESIGKPLPNRTNIVITKDSGMHPRGVIVKHNIEEAIKEAKKIEKEEIFIIGGGQIYQQSIKLADRLYLTVVEGEFPGDAFFPEYSQFTKIIKEEKGGSNGYKFKYQILEK